MNTECGHEDRSLIKLNKRGVGGAIALLLLLPSAVWAGGVVTNCTDADLRAAMAGGGVVTFARDGTITLSSTITNDLDLTLDGSEHQVTISGGNAVRVFVVNTNVSFTAVNLVIAAGRSLGGSAILNLGGSVNLSGVNFRSNTATINIPNDYLSPETSGGAIFNRGGAVHATNCYFADNTAVTPLGSTELSSHQVYGGAIRNEYGQVNLRLCAFAGNRASGGGPPPYYLGGYPGDPARGGAIHNAGTVTVDLCTFAGNSATGGDGVTWNFGGESSGGAIFNQGMLTMDRTTLTGC